MVYIPKILKTTLDFFSDTVMQILNVLMFVLKKVVCLDVCFDACSKNANFNLISILNILVDPVLIKRKS